MPILIPRRDPEHTVVVTPARVHGRCSTVLFPGSGDSFHSSPPRVPLGIPYCSGPYPDSADKVLQMMQSPEQVKTQKVNTNEPEAITRYVRTRKIPGSKRNPEYGFDENFLRRTPGAFTKRATR